MCPSMKAKLGKTIECANYIQENNIKIHTRTSQHSNECRSLNE